MMSDDIQSSAPESLTVGQRLRIARERLAYSQQQVAQRLCIKSVIVQQIEQDCMPAALSDIFIRGYIRSYARLVKIPEDELLPALTSQLSERPLKKGWQHLSLRRRHENRLMIVTWLVVFILLGLAGGWWWQHHSLAQEELSLLTKALLPEQIAESALEQTTAHASTARQSLDDPAQSSSNHLPSSSVLEENVMKQEVVFNFQGECWLEISDINRRLFSGLQKKGDQLAFNGQAPYQIAIGAPQVVELTYRGELVALSRYAASGQVARLTLPSE